MKCKSKIVRQYKKRGSASSLWPEHDPDNKLEVCGGEVHVNISIEGGGRCFCGDYCYCNGPELYISVSCSRCRNAFIDAELHSGRYGVSERINQLILRGLEVES